MHGARELWRQLLREGVAVGRDQVRRGHRRARAGRRHQDEAHPTTRPALVEARPADLVERVGAVDDHAITEIVRRYHDRPGPRDEVTVARIGREREEAGRRLAKTWDVKAWQREMAQLDAEEQAARGPVEAGRLSSGEVVDYLHSLPALWAEAGPDGRQALATALFARTEVTGFEQMVYELTPDAIELGLDVALPAAFELSGTIAEFGRGERHSPSLTQRSLSFLMVNATPREPPAPVELVRSA